MNQDDLSHVSRLTAYEDVPFLKRDECRPIRLQLEFLKPELIMSEHAIRSTIVLFGSARMLRPEDARKRVEELEEAVAEEPDAEELACELRRARKRLALTRYYEVAREFAARVSRESQDNEKCHYVIMTGGGGGIMEAGNRGAADVGSKSVGLNIKLPYEQVPNPYITPDLCFNFHYFSLRKMHFLLRARALCIFPGGFGTLDELFETLTLIQSGKIDPIPVVLFGQEQWDSIINWQRLVDNEFIAPEDLDIFHYCETADEAWHHIQQFWESHTDHPGSMDL